MSFEADKMKEATLRWFGDVRRRCKEVPVRRCESLTERVRRDKSRPQKKGRCKVCTSYLPQTPTPQKKGRCVSEVFSHEFT